MRKVWLTRNLIVLTLVSFTQDAASDLLYPLLPLLMASVTTAPALLLGVTEGLADLVAGVTTMWAGKRSDVWSRRGFITSGYGLAALGKVAVTFATAWPHFTLGRALDRFGKGLRGAPRDSLLADGIDDAHLGRAFGFHRAGDTAGAVLGPLIALAGLSLLNNDVREVAKWALIPAAISLFLTFIVQDHRPKQVIARAEKGEPLSPALKRMIGLMFAVSLTNVPDALLLLRLHEIGISATGVVFGYIIYNLVAALLALPAGVLSDKIGRDRVYVIGLAVFTISYIGLGSTDSPVISFFLMALYGCFPAFTDGVGKAWVTGLATAANRGRAQGAFRMWQTFGILLAGTWAGLTWNLGDGHGGFSLVFAGILCAIGGTVVFRARSTLRL